MPIFARRHDIRALVADNSACVGTVQSWLYLPSALMLYDPSRHEALASVPWNEAAARNAIRKIVERAEAAWSVHGWWPLHPLDREGGEKPGQVETPLYHGAAGVVWGLHYLESLGAGSLRRNYLGMLDNLRDTHSRWPGAAELKGSYLLGEMPIHLLQGNHGALLDLVESSIPDPARELMCGSPGAALVALFAHEQVGGDRYLELFRAIFDTLWSQLEWSEEHGCAYLRQQLFGREYTYLDAVHGLVSIVPPLLRGRHLLSPEQWSSWSSCIENTVRRTADRDGAFANWRPQLSNTADAAKKLLQFCHGAPGFVVTLAGWPGTNLDDLLHAGAETTWAAGPIKKGPNLCHGTAGNGYALLKMANRTGETHWLDRARRFAMHAIEQVESAAQTFGDGRHALWTGDLGVAIYLWDCIRGVGEFPTLDCWEARS